MKGVIDIKIKKYKTIENNNLRKEKIHNLSNNLDTSYIDYSDDKTGHILSK